MNVTTKIAGALLMGLVSSAALAEKGPYAFATLGQSSYASGSSPVSIRVGGGYNFTEIEHIGLTIGAEGAYADFGSSSGSIPFGTFATKTTGLMGNAIVTWKIPNVKGLNVIGKLGMLQASTSATATTTFLGTTTVVSASGTSTGTFFGAGVQYDFAPNFAVRGQYEDFGNAVTATNGTTSSLTMISAGIVYKF